MHPKESDFYLLKVAEDCIISLGTQLRPILENRIGEIIETGIRPENICISNIKETGSVTVTVNAYENMGNEQLIYITLGNETIIARRATQDQLAIGMKLFINFPRQKIIYIDTENGVVLT